MPTLRLMQGGDEEFTRWGTAARRNTHRPACGRRVPRIDAAPCSPCDLWRRTTTPPVDMAHIASTYRASLRAAVRLRRNCPFDLYLTCPFSHRTLMISPQFSRPTIPGTPGDAPAAIGKASLKAANRALRKIRSHLRSCVFSRHTGERRYPVF